MGTKRPFGCMLFGLLQEVLLGPLFWLKKHIEDQKGTQDIQKRTLTKSSGVCLTGGPPTISGVLFPFANQHRLPNKSQTHFVKC